MSAFDNVHLPEDIESGALIGPTFSTTVITLSGGNEQRNADWDQEILKADIAYGIMAKEDPKDAENSFQRVLSFFRARLGRHRSFLFKDWADYEAVGETLYADPDDPTKFQCTKRYDNYLRRLTRPRPETVVLERNGDLLPHEGGATPAWSVMDLGIIQFASNPGFSTLEASFEFDIPVRFESDTMQVTIEWQDAGSIPSINLLQDRE